MNPENRRILISLQEQMVKEAIRIEMPTIDVRPSAIEYRRQVRMQGQRV